MGRMSAGSLIQMHHGNAKPARITMERLGIQMATHTVLVS